MGANTSKTIDGVTLKSGYLCFCFWTHASVETPSHQITMRASPLCCSVLTEVYKKDGTFEIDNKSGNVLTRLLCCRHTETELATHSVPEKIL
jgi:hypothetical protein